MQFLTQAEQEIQLTLEVNAGDSLYLKPEDYITGITNDVGDVCRQDTNENMHMSQGAPQGVSFRNVAHDVGFRSRQAKVKTSPNCIFPCCEQNILKLLKISRVICKTRRKLLLCLQHVRNLSHHPSYKSH